MRKVCNIIVLALSIYFQSYSQSVNNPSKQTNGTTKQHTLHIVTVRSYIHHISDIDYKNQEYKIELWLYLTSKDSLSDSLAEQVQVKDAKETSISFIPLWHERKRILDSLFIADTSDTSLTADTCFRRILKIKCTMIKFWNVDDYPFDKQSLDITIYTVRPLSWLLFRPVGNKINNYANNNKDSIWKIENTWYCIQNSTKITTSVLKNIFVNTNVNIKRYSALNYNIPIYRTHNWGLFFKMLIGMYVAFGVAFIALFIPVHRVEPRFGLPVGGLFAAIGNKYIIDSLLPLSTQFTLVDILHSIAIFSIFIIIAYSAFLLFLTEKIKENEQTKDKLLKKSRQIKRLNVLIIILLSLSYILVNIWFINWGWA